MYFLFPVLSCLKDFKSSRMLIHVSHWSNLLYSYMHRSKECIVDFRRLVLVFVICKKCGLNFRAKIPRWTEVLFEQRDVIAIDLPAVCWQNNVHIWMRAWIYVCLQQHDGTYAYLKKYRRALGGHLRLFENIHISHFNTFKSAKHLEIFTEGPKHKTESLYIKTSISSKMLLASFCKNTAVYMTI